MPEIGALKLLPPSKDVCQECAVKHEVDEPHNKDSLYYQYYFRSQHDRWPTWDDAMAHCDESTKAAWQTLLKEFNARE